MAFACSSDSDGGGSSSGLTVDGTHYTISDAKMVDNYRLFYESGSEFDFILSNGEITVEADPGTSIGFTVANGTISIDAYLFCQDATLTNGTYTFDEFPESETGYFFDDLIVTTDSNGDHQIDSSDNALWATGGTIEVTGSGNNRTLDFDVTLSDGSTLDYTYHSGFDYVDNRND